ncbi:uncharacterized protein LOC134776919 [Penaeus indicus]|uniref:uncharacterized protein LOC134776919 n=1 Tax=Penaeus indicus TaxID=29960 RepID=UPI00300CA26F
MCWSRAVITVQTVTPTTLWLSARINNPELREHFAKAIDVALEGCPAGSATERWNHIREAVFQTAMGTFGKRERKSADWFESGVAELEPAIAAKRAALLAHKNYPSMKTLATLRAACCNTQRIARRCANNYWSSLCQDIQLFADMGKVRGMYDTLKKAFGPSTIKTGPIKSAEGVLIKDRSKQMERWAEHFQKLYSRETTVSNTALERTHPLPTMDELDAPPTIEELSKAIDSLASGKAPGSDNSLLQHLHMLLLQCWEEGAVPQDMRNAMIITIYKNKGERIVGKAFARVDLDRLQLLAERVYPEAQCGFRTARSTIDMVFSVRQLQEKCREQRQPLYLAFIDLTKAFDLVSRDGLFALLQRIGCPPKLLSQIVSFHQDMSGTVQFDGLCSEPFPIRNGVKQGCVLAPTLFGIFFSLLLSHAFGDSDDGIFIHTRSDGGLFNLACLRAKTKPPVQSIGLTISLKKTQVMGQDVSSAPSISIGDHTLEVGGEVHLSRATISSNLSLDAELNTRIGKAATAMARLTKRVWDNTMLTINTKIRVYQACVLSTLLFSSR